MCCEILFFCFFQNEHQWKLIWHLQHWFLLSPSHQASLRIPTTLKMAPENLGGSPVSVHKLLAPPSHLPLHTSLSWTQVLCRLKPSLRKAEHPTTAHTPLCTASFCWAAAPQAKSPEGWREHSQEGPEGTLNARCPFGKSLWTSDCWLLRR